MCPSRLLTVTQQIKKKKKKKKTQYHFLLSIWPMTEENEDTRSLI